MPHNLEVWNVHEPKRSCIPWPWQDADSEGASARLAAVRIKRLQGHSGNVKALRTGTHDGAQCGDVLFSAASDGRCIVWDKRKLKKRRVLGEGPGVTRGDCGPTHDFPVFSMCPLLTDANKLVTGAADKMLKVWDWENNKPVSVLLGHSTAPLSIAADRGHLIYSGSRSGRIRVWDLRMGPHASWVGNLGPPTADLYQQPGGGAHTAAVAQLRYHADRDELLSVSFDSLAKAWPCSAPAGVPPARVFRGHSGVIRDMAFGGDNNECLVTCSVNRHLRLWSLSDASERSSLHLDGWANNVEVMGDKIVTGLQDHVVGVWAGRFELCRDMDDLGEKWGFAASPMLYSSGPPGTIRRPETMHRMQPVPLDGATSMQSKTFVVVCTGERDGRPAYYRRRTHPEELGEIDKLLRQELEERARKRRERQPHGILRRQGSNLGRTPSQLGAAAAAPELDSSTRRAHNVRWDLKQPGPDGTTSPQRMPAAQHSVFALRNQIDELLILNKHLKAEVELLQQKQGGGLPTSGPVSPQMQDAQLSSAFEGVDPDPEAEAAGAQGLMQKSPEGPDSPDSFAGDPSTRHATQGSPSPESPRPARGAGAGDEDELPELAAAPQGSEASESPLDSLGAPSGGSASQGPQAYPHAEWGGPPY
eukprot:TRINITY_DN12264_c0_g1_i2.p1 TRINITY_DN12264_c0_g1~~TRINITY_DN12264_c0_g1_i2.p1  ORF type:complete len:754 (+),score=183.80 TRINITY_DN12264_c0_g1_i2:326-2263(+)